MADGDRLTLIERSFREKIVLVGMRTSAEEAEEVERSLDELELLVNTAGADVVARVQQNRAAPDPRYYVGKGKAQELKAVAHETDCDTVVFDDELTPAQQFNLERLLGRTAIDRTAVILDIFAQNAHSPEGKAQVELALLNYRLPRLRGSGGRLSQQAGGIGTRGPGETKLEIDRRRLERRVHQLERELKTMRRHRDTRHKARRRSRLPQVAIVGYTNAGKSTLLNRLTDAGVLAEDRLFATLDATTRQLTLPRGGQALVTDTVGFVRKLPHQLVEAFMTTLEVVTDAELVIHVVDGSAADPLTEAAAVRSVLVEIGAGDIPELLVHNKMDRADARARLLVDQVGAVPLSALSGDGIDDFLAVLADRLHADSRLSTVLIPFTRGDLMAMLHREGEVLEESAEEGGLLVQVRLDDAARSRFAPYLVDPVAEASDPEGPAVVGRS